MTSRKTAWDSSTVTSSDTFSPLSGGSRKPAIIDLSTTRPPSLVYIFYASLD